MSIGEFIGAFFTSSSTGGVVVIVVFLTASMIYYRLTRWIIDGGKEENRDLFS
jgi:hypothetical protein